MDINNYFLKKGKVFRKKYYCEKSKKMYLEKELKIQNINRHPYVYINGKLTNLERVKLLLSK